METLIIILLLVVGLILPSWWILAIWLDDRLLSHARGVTALLAHIGIICWLALKHPLYGAIYGGLLAGVVLFMPILGLQSEKRKRIRQAKSDVRRYQALLARHPENAGAHSALGDAYLECHCYDDAIAAYHHAISLDPDNYRVEEGKIKYASIQQQAHERRKRRKGLAGGV